MFALERHQVANQFCFFEWQVGLSSNVQRFNVCAVLKNIEFLAGMVLRDV